MLYNAVGIYVLVVSLLSVFVIVLVARQGRTHKDVSIWLVSGLVGILLGAAAAGAVVQALGYELAKKNILPEGITLASMSQEAVETGMPTGSGTGMSCGTGSGSGMSCGTGSGAGMGCGMAGSEVPPRVQLAMLVHKINLLTSDISLHLSDAQAARLVEILTRIKSQQGISNDQAAALQKQILDQFDVAQKAKPDSIGLPPSAASGVQSVQGQVANPFEGQQNAQALQSLLDRLSKPAATRPVAAAAP
jgi:hypothetical protein